LWIGGVLRKSRKPFSVIASKTSINFCCASFCGISKTASEKTKLKGRIWFIAHNVSNNVTHEDKPDMSLFSRMMTTSENNGDVMVEKTSMRVP